MYHYTYIYKRAYNAKPGSYWSYVYLSRRIELKISHIWLRIRTIGKFYAEHYPVTWLIGLKEAKAL